MADLVTLTGFDSWLGGAVAAENTIRTDILTLAKDRFTRECGRTHIPFLDAQAARVEYRDGTGSCELYLDYPITTLTSITLGFDHAAPTETLTIADLLYAAGQRRIVRLDGYFGDCGWPRYVKVTYDAAADLPTDAAGAIYRAAATLYRQRGSEDTVSERAGPYSADFRDPFADVVWLNAVANHARVL